MLHFTELRTAKAPSLLFLGDKNKACTIEKHKRSQPDEPQVLFVVHEKDTSYSVPSFNTRIGQQNVSDII